jgi:type II secretion system protein N
MKVDWTLWRPRLAYGAFALVAFVLSLRWTFPAEAMKERLIMEAGRRGWQIDMERVSAAGLLGMNAEGVKLETASGLAIPMEELTASLRLLPLLAGRRSVAFDAALYDGHVEGTADLSGEARRLALDLREVDLARALPLRKAAGVDLRGKASGTADLTLPDAPDQRPTGRVDLTVAEAGIAGGQLPLPGMASGLTLPPVGLGQVVAALRLADGKGTFEKLEATGGEAEVRTEGLYFVVQPRMEFSPLSGKAKVKVQDAFWSKSPATQSFRGLADAALASAKGSDGAWSFAVTGSVGHPRMQPSAAGR